MENKKVLLLLLLILLLGCIYYFGFVKEEGWFNNKDEQEEQQIDEPIEKEMSKANFEQMADRFLRVLTREYQIMVSREMVENRLFQIEEGMFIDDRIMGVDVNLISKGTFIITSEGNMAMAIHNDEWCALKGFDEEEVSIIEFEANCINDDIRNYLLEND